jgi:putative membrane protein
MLTKNIIPKWASSYISEQEIKQIELKISEIEMKTTGEIVVLIVKRSSFIKYIGPALFFILMMFSLFTLNWYIHDLWFSRIENYFFYFLDLILMIFLTTVLVRIPLIQRTFLHPLDMENAFQRRAVSEYFEANLYKTHYNTAVLIMVSLLERKAIILASYELNKAVDDKLWNDCIAKIIEGAKQKSLGQGFLGALEKISPILEIKFPLSLDPGNPNEISNSVIIKE